MNLLDINVTVVSKHRITHLTYLLIYEIVFGRYHEIQYGAIERNGQKKNLIRLFVRGF